MPSPLRRTDRSLPIALLRARETVMEPIREMLSQSQISEQKWRVLRVIDEAGPIEQTTIAQRACLLLPSLTRILHAMERDDWITRSPSREDKRKSIVTVTNAGRALIAKHADQSNAVFAKLEAEFGREKLDQLLDLLEDLQGVGK
jgi:homoprotocatechuate degradation regulator HpaR